MTSENHIKDLELANRICEELRNGSANAITELFQLFHPFFLAFSKKRIFSFDPQIAEGMMIFG